MDWQLRLITAVGAIFKPPQLGQEESDNATSNSSMFETVTVSNLRLAARHKSAQHTMDSWRRV